MDLHCSQHFAQVGGLRIASENRFQQNFFWKKNTALLGLVGESPIIVTDGRQSGINPPSRVSPIPPRRCSDFPSKTRARQWSNLPYHFVSTKGFKPTIFKCHELPPLQPSSDSRHVLGPEKLLPIPAE